MKIWVFLLVTIACVQATLKRKRNMEWKVIEELNEDGVTVLVFCDHLIDTKNYSNLPKPAHSMILELLVGSPSHWNYLHCCQKIYQSYTWNVFVNQINSFVSLHKCVFWHKHSSTPHDDQASSSHTLDQYFIFYQKILKLFLRWFHDKSLCCIPFRSIDLPVAYRDRILCGDSKNLPPLPLSSIRYQLYTYRCSSTMPLVLMYNRSKQEFMYSSFSLQKISLTFATITNLQLRLNKIILPEFFILEDRENTMLQVDVISKDTCFVSYISDQLLVDVLPEYANDVIYKDYRMLYIKLKGSIRSPRLKKRYAFVYLYHPQSCEFRFTVFTSEYGKSYGKDYEYTTDSEYFDFIDIIPFQEFVNQAPILDTDNWFIRRVILTDGRSILVNYNQ